MNLFLARRFFRSGNKENKRKASAPAIRIATAGVALGLVVMILSLCMVKGFQSEVSRKLTGFASQMEILDLKSCTSPESYPIVTDAAFIDKVRHIPGVARVQRVSGKMGILKTEDSFQGVALKGVGQDYDLNFIRENLVEGEMPVFTDSASTNKILISQMQADALGLKVGGRVYAYFFENTVKMRRFEIAGIYRTNLSQYDKLFVITDIYTVGRLNGWEPDQSSALELSFDDFDRLDEMQVRVARVVNGTTDRNGASYSALSIKENPRVASVFTWLELLDFNVLIILVLMVCVAGFTMVSGLLILILERTNTIGVLKAMGATNTRIRHIFLWFAAMIVGRGLLIGDAVGLAVIWAQSRWGLVRLDPATYYVDAVPVEFNVWWILGLNVATLFITVLALIVPSFMISRIQPARVIRFD